MSRKEGSDLELGRGKMELLHASDSLVELGQPGR